MTAALTFVEIDVPFCALTYGSAPCTASIPTTGLAKCYNSLGTCQDRANFDNEPVTLRFAQPTDGLPRDVEAMPSIASVAYTPATISLGQDLGTRASVKVVFDDHRYADTGTGGDPYRADRSHAPFGQGTYWGKFRARHPYLQGRPLRLIMGFGGQALGAMETRHFIIEKAGPTPDGKRFEIIANDMLRLTRGDRAQAPALSGGHLSAGISDSDTSATLLPAGIGDAEYAASGWVNLGGDEIAAFTRSGDALTLTRAQLGTTASAHAAEDKVQQVLRYQTDDVADIIHDLLVTHAGFDANLINLTDWQQETSAYLGTVYTGTIPEPTGVEQLLKELIQQAGLVLFWDDMANRLRLLVLRQVSPTAATLTERDWLEGTLSAVEQPERRLSRVWTRYAMVDPTEGASDPRNFASVAAEIDVDAEADYGSAKKLEIYSRWIPALASSAADRVNAIQLGRFRDPPRRLQFAMPRLPGKVAPVPGDTRRIQGTRFQDADGAEDSAGVPLQLVRVEPRGDRYLVEAEEFRWTTYPGASFSERTLTIAIDTEDFDLEAAHDNVFPDLPTGSAWSAGSYNADDVVTHEGAFWTANTTTTEEPGDAATDWDLTARLTCIINAGVTVTASSPATTAFTVGDWPAGFVPIIVVRGDVDGCPGAGGKGAINRASGDDVVADDGEDGGIAIYTRHPIVLQGDGRIRGGAGGGGGGGTGFNWFSDQIGGGGGGGGGGNGSLGGEGLASADDGEPGTKEAGGAGGEGSGSNGYDGGDGGDPGQDGDDGTPGDQAASQRGLGGTAGAAVDGWSDVTDDSTITFAGNTVN